MKTTAVIWAILGISCLLLSAIYRLAPMAIEALTTHLTIIQWVLLAFWVIFMLVAEGYRGFQKKFSPRTAARIRYLRNNTTLPRALFAPIFAMGFFHANKKTRLTAIFLTLGIIGLILLVRLCPQPWRGLIDVGVVLGLSYGLLSFYACTAKALSSASYPHDPCVPE